LNPLNALKSNPKIAVLLATYNGDKWLASQLDSILRQLNVSVTLFVSDDSSQDSTFSYLKKCAEKDLRVKILPRAQRARSAGKNFFRLLLDTELADCDYVALADQDDIWRPDKLIRHVELMRKNEVDGMSSNVTAFWPDGKTKLIDKSQPQRELDFLFESAGPGCTFLMTPWLVNEVKKQLTDSSSVANQVALHDWLVYAICRASGKKWLIDSESSIEYRQHDKNVVGANSGLKAKLERFKQISNGWYRQEVLKILDVSCQLSDDHQLHALKKVLQNPSFKSRISLLSYVHKARRRFYDRLFLGLMIILGLF